MTQLQHPFIYISALMRTGSTMLSEALTAWPYSFIFREPDLGKNAFTLRPGDAEFLLAHGINVGRFWRRRSHLAFVQRRLRGLGYRQDYAVRTFKRHLVADLSQQIMQVGVKEVHNNGWENYLRLFPDMKVIVIARDPRDIYISNFQRFQRGLLKHEQAITPEKTAAELNQEFQLQLALCRETPHFIVRYEDICTDADILDEIKAFVNSPIPTTGQIGQFLTKHPDRIYEHALHGGKITKRSVARWTKEPDERLVQEAQRTFDLMPDYCRHWGYI